MTGRWSVAVVVALALLGAGLLDGVVQQTLLSDRTGIVWVICALAFVGTVSSRWFPTFNDWMVMEGLLLMVGLLGTVVGFMLALEGATTDNLAMKLDGVGTALATTATGIVAQLHLMIFQRAMR